jgi:hypothetical protein
MTAFNVVRFRTKPGREQDFIEGHRDMAAERPDGARRFVLVRTGDNEFCALGEWETFNHIVQARPTMIGFLDRFRDMLEVLSDGLGVTDPVSGEAVVDMGEPAPAPAKKTRRAGVAKRKPASRARATSPRQGKPAAKKRAAKKGAAKAAARKTAKKSARKAGIRRR